ncbi:hypothetical protein, partial [Streptomyces albus]|uniref:hypothetical protein n=1 Tax=Streptomyces albus TaxID=1888 RepID=UPI00197EC8BC
MTAVEDRLRAALRARAGQVTGLGPPPPLPVGKRTGMRPGLRKALVVALAAVLATVVLVLPHFLSRDDAPGPPGAEAGYLSCGAIGMGVPPVGAGDSLLSGRDGEGGASAGPGASSR